MKSRRANRQEIKRAVQAAAEAGFEAAELIIGAHGEIRLVARNSATSVRSAAEIEIARHFEHAKR